MQLSTIIPHIEALIFASEKPLTEADIVELINNAFGFMEERFTNEQVEAAVQGIREKYAAEFYPFELRQSGGGWQFLTKKEFHKTVSQLNGDKFLKRLSNAALETLAIIAYKQPITKGEVEAIRGVNSDYSIQKLLEKELIVISGRSENLPGKPLVYTTSKSFMDYFGLNSVEDLPKIKEVLADQAIEGTIISEGMKKSEVSSQEDQDEEGLTVTHSGELVQYTLRPHADNSGSMQEEDPTENDADEGDEQDEKAILPPASDLEAFSDAGEDTEESDFDDEEAISDNPGDDISDDSGDPGEADDIDKQKED